MRSGIDRMSHVISGSLQTALLNLPVLAETRDQGSEAEPSIGLIRTELLRASRLLGAAFEVLSLELGPVRRLDLRALVTDALHAQGLGSIAVAPGAWPALTG